MEFLGEFEGEWILSIFLGLLFVCFEEIFYMRFVKFLNDCLYLIKIEYLFIKRVYYVYILLLDYIKEVVSYECWLSFRKLVGKNKYLFLEKRVFLVIWRLKVVGFFLDFICYVVC